MFEIETENLLVVLLLPTTIYSIAKPIEAIINESKNKSIQKSCVQYGVSKIREGGRILRLGVPTVIDLF